MYRAGRCSSSERFILVTELDNVPNEWTCIGNRYSDANWSPPTFVTNTRLLLASEQYKIPSTCSAIIINTFY